MIIVCLLLRAYLVVMVLAAVLSWFPLQPDTFFYSARLTLQRLVDPLLEPLRRLIPPAGMIDLSFMALFFIVLIASQIVCG